GISGAGTSDTARFCIDGQTPLTFNGISSGGYTNPLYQWQISMDTGRTWNDITGETTVSYTRPPSPTAGFYQYRQVVGEGSNVTLSSCRVSSNVLTVQVNPKPLPAALNDGPKCEGDSLTLKASDGATYSWTGPGGFTAAGSSVGIPGITPARAGTYQVLVTSSYGCTQTDATTVLVYPRPVAQFISGSPPCEQTSLSFTDGSSAVGQTLTAWKWYFGDGDSAIVESPTHAYKSSGSYPAGLIVTSDKGCKSFIQTNTIAIHDLPHPDFTLPKICIADPQAVFNDKSDIADGTAPAFTYRWDFGEPASGAANTSTQKDGTHKYQTAGPYSVTLKVTSDAGCAKDTTMAFMVNGDNPQAHFTIADASELCSNQPVVLTDASSVTPGRIIRIEAYWDYQHDPAIDTIDEDPSAGAIYSHNYPDFSNPATKDYRIHYVAWSGENCMAQIDRLITIKASPRTQFDALSSVCEGKPFFPLTEGRETEGFAGIGAYSGRGVSRQGFFDPRLAGPGPDTIHYTFTADDGCYSSSEQTILVYPQPTADAGPAQYILQGDIGTLEGSGAGKNITFNWQPADSILGDPHVPHPGVSPQEDLVYTLKVTSADNCTDSSQVQVFVLKMPVVPNAFSPNGDGINDTWVIRYLDEYPRADVQVFNRWGQPVYHVTGYTTPWDGTYKGQPLPIGTYYWIIRPGNGRRQMSGSITILR
ncbi:MAG TPA: PKD domain-containing protein, partial [Puia sp.]|nr:PKD domain-containing protein [Puia sp.]